MVSGPEGHGGRTAGSGPARAGATRPARGVGNARAGGAGQPGTGRKQQPTQAREQRAGWDRQPDRHADRTAAAAPVPDVYAGVVARTLGLVLPPEVQAAYSNPPAGARGLLYRPDLGADDPMSLAAALSALGGSVAPVPPNLLPLAPVDDMSMAVVLCQPMVEGPDSAPEIPGVGLVLRWHLGDVPPAHQAEVLDLDAVRYLTSASQELNAREAGLTRMSQVAQEYDAAYVKPGNAPKSYVERPVQLACQNVIVGLASMRYDSGFDGLNVPLWQSCEVPHVAAHEGTRALLALILCDAFQSGGTMEIRFQGHPERGVPAALRRYARTLGVPAGAADSRCLTPVESRDLFMAVTPMTPGLAAQARVAIRSGQLTPERLCFTLISGLWRDIEVEFMLATSPRAGSVLAGGAPFTDRAARAAETELACAALLVGTLRSRLDLVDTAGDAGEVRVFEDTTRGVAWEVLPELAAVAFDGLPGPVPWTRGQQVPLDQGLFVFPRSNPTSEDIQLAEAFAIGTSRPVALLVPSDRSVPAGSGLLVLYCPDGVADLHAAAERSLLTARVSRS